MKTKFKKIIDLQIGDKAFFCGHTPEEITKIAPYGNSSHSLMFSTKDCGYHAVKTETIEVVVAREHVNFTEKEWEVITHRPEDCILECISGDTDKWGEEEIKEKTNEVFAKRPAEKINLGDPLVFEIIRNCIRGCTFMIGLHDEVRDYGFEKQNKGEFLSYCRAAKAIERKTGIKFP